MDISTESLASDIFKKEQVQLCQIGPQNHYNHKQENRPILLQSFNLKI